MGQSRGWVTIWGRGPLFVPLSALSAFPGPWPFTDSPRQEMWASHCSRKFIPSERWGHGQLPEVDGLDHTVGPAYRVRCIQ